MAVKCTNCGGAHPSWDCSKPTKSTASRKEVAVCEVGDKSLKSQPSKSEKLGRERAAPADAQVRAGTQALPVDTHPKPKMGRPRTGYIKAEYNRQYSADQRTIKRLGLNCTVAEFRKAKEK